MKKSECLTEHSERPRWIVGMDAIKEIGKYGHTLTATPEPDLLNQHIERCATELSDKIGRYEMRLTLQRLSFRQLEELKSMIETTIDDLKNNREVSF